MQGFSNASNDEEITILLYDEETNEQIAKLTAFMNSEKAVAELLSIKIFDERKDRVQILNTFLNYIYQNDYFKILYLFLNIQESGFKDFELQCCNFYTKEVAICWYHINPQYLYTIKEGTEDEELREKLIKAMERKNEGRKKYLNRLHSMLLSSKKLLEEEQNNEILKKEVVNLETILEHQNGEELKR